MATLDNMVHYKPLTFKCEYNLSRVLSLTQIEVDSVCICCGYYLLSVIYSVLQDTCVS